MNSNFGVTDGYYVGDPKAFTGWSSGENNTARDDGNSSEMLYNYERRDTDISKSYKNCAEGST